MEVLDFEPEMVGRDKELKELQTYLDKAVQGHGNTIFISGEAGIGKTRLVNELKLVAQSKDFMILSGNSLSESLTPYMPIIDALRSGDLENLFAEEAPRVEAVFLATHSGLLVKEVIREETDLNPDIFTSMLTTVGNFVKDSLSMMSGVERKGALNTLGFENFRILIESGKDTSLVVILTGRENEFLINDMREIFLKIYKRYEHALKDWDGEEESIYDIENLMEPLVTSGKYDGIYYGKQDPKARRNLLFENVSLGLIRQSQRVPTLLCIEDMQWSDPSSLALMHYVARNTRKSGLLILGTYRPEDVTVADGKGHPLTYTMQLMDREDLCEELRLQRLPKKAITNFLSSLLGNIDFNDEFKDRIFKETDGNPLFIIQLIKFLVEENIIKTYNGTWKLSKDLRELDIPSKIYNVILRRLNRVDKEDRKILNYASVIGETFSSQTLVEAMKFERVQLLERLSILEKTHKLINSFNGTFKFDHAKIKEVLYGEMPHELRMEYHAIIADSIEKLNRNDLDEVIGELAFHYYRCGKSEKALLYLIMAAEKAKKDYSNEEANSFYNEALELEKDDKKRMEIFENLGDVYDLLGEYEKCRESYENALALAHETNIKSEIMSKISRIYMTTKEFDTSLKICYEALDLVKGKGSKEEALALNNIGNVFERRGETDRALEYHRKSLAIKEKIGNQRGIATSYHNIGLVYSKKGDCSKALKYLNMSLEIEKKLGAQHGIATTLNYIGIVYSDLGDYQKALSYYKESLAIMEKVADPLGISYVLNNIGLDYEEQGEFDLALEFHERSLEMKEKLAITDDAAYSLTNIGLVYKGRGEYDKALENLWASLKMLKKMDESEGLAILYHSMAETYLEKTDLEEALDFCNKSFEIASNYGNNVNIAISRKIFGMIYKAQENWKKSIDNFNESIRIFKEMGLDKKLGYSYFEFGLMWKSMGDSKKAKEHLHWALQIFENLKFNYGVEKAREALKTL